MAGAPCSLTSSLLQQPEGREMCGSGDGGLEARDAACVYPSSLHCPICALGFILIFPTSPGAAPVLATSDTECSTAQRPSSRSPGAKNESGI